MTHKPLPANSGRDLSFGHSFDADDDDRDHVPHLPG